MAVGELTVRQTVIGKMPLGKMAVSELTWYRIFQKLSTRYLKRKKIFSAFGETCPAGLGRGKHAQQS